MAFTGIKFNMAEWRRFGRSINPSKFSKRLRKEVGIATGANAKILQVETRRVIRGGKLAKNAALTIAIKRSSKPLVDFGDLFGAVTTVQKSWDKAFVGILRRDEKHNIALILHEGGALPITDKMRGLFFVLWLKTRATAEGKAGPQLTGRAEELWARFKDWSPIRPSKRAIKIPARPFLRIAFENPAIQKQIQARWAKAVQRALKAK